MRVHRPAEMETIWRQEETPKDQKKSQRGAYYPDGWHSIKINKHERDKCIRVPPVLFY